MRREERFRQVIAWFRENRPVAETELVYRDPYELAVAVILSAQCTDKRVNLLTPAFFASFPTVQDLAGAQPQEVLALIKSCSYPNNKTRNLIAMACTVVEKYDGRLPDNQEELQKIPGIGRKSANVLASVAFHKPALAVDTHVFRVAARIGLSVNAKNPLETERQLVRHIPEELLSIAHHWLILHGRYVCTARKPACSDCGLKEFCRYFNAGKG
ncbi:MAG TPA: endonuclease III [Bacteroidales bacterium]|nr:endonuclease III [Bacteroidales bacterium]